MASRPKHFSETTRVSKRTFRYGPLKWTRVDALPVDSFGRNGDFVIIDNTAVPNDANASLLIPTTVSLGQKVPLGITAGDFTITAASGVYTITIATINDLVDAITDEKIPELRAEYADYEGAGDETGNNIILHSTTVTFADGTSDLPSKLGITGVQVGRVTVSTGTWLEFPIGSTGINVDFGGGPVAGGPFTTLDFTGAGVASIVNAGAGEATITISGGGGGGTAYGIITGDTGTATATTAGEAITFSGSGVNVVATDAGAGFDTVAFNLDIASVTAGVGTIVAGDEIAVNDGGSTVRYTFADLLADLEVPNAITGTGIVVKTGDAPDTFTTRSLAASALEDAVGISVVDGDGVAGNATIGLDINGLTNAADDMAATDEFPVHNKSEGTGGANRKMTGQDVADGVATILGLNNGLTFTTINGQEILTFTDPTRASKILSIDSSSYTFSMVSVSDGGWLSIGNAIDTDAGHIMPFNGTVVGVTAMTENANGGTNGLDLFINAALDTAAIATLSGVAVDTDINMTMNRDFLQGDRLRLQVDRTIGAVDMQDVVINLIVRWRA